MQVYLFRHAEKNPSLHRDPGLSSRGQEQAQKIAEELAPLAQSSWLFLSSPKQRAQQTILPLTLKLKASLQQVPELDERHPDETAESFCQRINSKIRWMCTADLQNSPGLILVSHSDWIHEALSLIPSDSDLKNESYHWWSPGQFMHFHVQNQLWHLESFSQF